MTNSIFILGGGRMGLVTARDLAESDEIEEIVIGDVDTSKADRLSKEIGSDKVRSTKVDATQPDQLAAAIRSSRVLVNATWYEYNLRVMEACISAGVHYTDLGGLFHMTRRQLKLNRAAKKAGIIALPGGGESPGITNILCALSAERLDSVEEIRIRVGGRTTSRTPPGKIAFPFAVPTIFDEYTRDPVMYLNGKFERVAPLSGEETVEFPEPVGRNRCHYTLHSEIATLPVSLKGVRNVDFKLGISEEIFKAIRPLIEAEMLEEGIIDVKGHSISPRDFAVALLSSRASTDEPTRWVGIRTEVVGARNGRRRKCVCEIVQGPSDHAGMRNATAFLTGTAASIIAQLLMTGKIVESGVLPPETAIPSMMFVKELGRRGIVVKTAVT